MERIINLPKDVFDEVLQKETAKSCILYEILYSKRLLIEHVEILEECLYEVESLEGLREVPFIRPVYAGALTILSGITSLFGKRFLVIPAVTVSYSILCLGKYIQSFRIRRNKECLHKLLRSIEEFENIIKKHILFFNELQKYKTGTHIPEDSSFVNTCIQCLKDVILMIYDGIKELESEYKISKKYELVYEPIENLCQTEYFVKDLEEFNAKHIKEFLNLFLYVQSQYLLRLGLIVATGSCDSDFIKYNTINLTPLIDEQTSNCSYNFDLIMFVASPEKSSHQFRKITERKSVPLDLLRSKSYSLTFVPKLLALTHECMKLDSVLNHLIENFDENDKELDDFHDLLPIMSQLDSELLLCQDEYQRLFITYQKFLNLTPNMEANEQESVPSEEKVQEKIEHDFRKVGETAFGYHDDFFALDVLEDYEHEKESIRNDNKTLDEDDEQINRKIVKKTFRPVLKQLKAKIEPLADAMKERERKVLEAKGIDIDEIMNDGKTVESQKLEQEILSCGSNSDFDDDEDERLKRKRAQNTSQKYNEMRQFLEQKQQINIFGLKTVAPIVQEDVIE